LAVKPPACRQKRSAVRDHVDAMARALIDSLLEQQSRSSEKDEDISTVR
jgi:hypothetical protein